MSNLQTSARTNTNTTATSNAATAAFLLEMAEEWGSANPRAVARWSRPLAAPEVDRPKRPMTEERYVAAVRDVLRNFRRDAEFAGDDAKAGYYDGLAAEDARLIIGLGLNHIRPLDWGRMDRRVDGALAEWHRLMPRSEVVGSTNNLDPEFLFALYRAKWTRGLPTPVGEKYWIDLGSVQWFLQRAFRQRDWRTFLWIWRNPEEAMFVGDRSYGNLRRVAKGGLRMRWAIRFMRNRARHEHGGRTSWLQSQEVHWEATLEEIQRAREAFWVELARLLRGDDFWEIVAPKKATWIHYHRRIPTGELGDFLVREIPKSEIKNFVWKKFHKVFRHLQDLGLHLKDAAKGAIALIGVFGPRWKTWLQRMEAQHVGAHDATYWLPTTTQPDLGAWLLRHLETNQETLRLVVSRWGDLSDKDRKLPTAEIVAVIRASAYGSEASLNRALAEECSRWGVSKERFSKYVRKYSEGLSGLKAEDVPGFPPVRDGELTAYRLTRGDVRGLFLGEHTNCCQSVGNVASSCAWHGATGRNGGFVVVERQGRIVAQSYVWRDGDHLVFDSLECLGERKMFRPIMLAAAREMVGRLGVSGVYAGAGYGASDERVPNPFIHPASYRADSERVRLIAGKAAE